MSDDARKDTQEQADFRQYCRDWLADNRPPEPTVRLPLSPLEIMTTEQLCYLQDWQQSAYDAGLVGCDYPQEVGGGGRKDCQRVARARPFSRM
jgi:alkylation response protein AidB-like acyl-CoA dehydrogenase